MSNEHEGIKESTQNEDKSAFGKTVAPFLVIARDFRLAIGFGLLGMVAAVTIYIISSQEMPVSTTARVSFAFEGFERGEYPDHSNFQPDDLRAPEIIAEAFKEQGIAATEAMQSQVRGAIEIEGIVPPAVIRQRDRLRASGQTPPAYVADEYTLTLTLPRNYPLTIHQREMLLHEITNTFREHFARNYAALPSAFGTAFSTLRDADFSEYELVFNNDINTITNYLKQQIAIAKSFRSPATNMSFDDLLGQVDLFSRIELDGILGMIRQDGLSRDRAAALVKMDYYYKQLEVQESQAIADEGVVKELLAQVQNRTPNYVLGVKETLAQPRAGSPIVDEGLIESLVANDSYNMLVRKALDSGIAVKHIQGLEAQLQDQRKILQSFLNKDSSNQAAIIAQVTTSLAAVEEHYNRLIADIRETHADFARQQYANAVRLSDSVRTSGILLRLIESGVLGAFLGVTFGIGIQLVGHMRARNALGIGP